MQPTQLFLLQKPGMHVVQVSAYVGPCITHSPCLEQKIQKTPWIPNMNKVEQSNASRNKTKIRKQPAESYT